MDYIRLGLYGDSLSMARPGLVKPEDRYFHKIQEYYYRKFPDTIIETVQRSKASISSSEIAKLIYHDNVYYNWPGELCIVHLGIVDCAPRPIDIVFREKISKWPSLLKRIAIKYLHNNRRKMLLAGKVHYVTPVDIFRSDFSIILKEAITGYKRVVVINICPTNQATEYKSPGLGEAIQKYNTVIKEQIAEFNSDKIALIDIHQMISEKENVIDDYINKEDGHHISPLTHNLVFNRIKEYLQ